MQLPDLSLIYKTIVWHNEQRDKKPGESVGIFAILPKNLAIQFPEDGRAGEDSSPVHVTVLYVGDVPFHLEEKIKNIAHSVCEKVKPFNVKLSKPKKFINDKQQTIVHSPVKSNKLNNFHDELKNAFRSKLISVDSKFPEFKPHVTIRYINPDDRNKYDDPKPEGEWMVESVWLWGMSEPFLIPLGK